VSSHFQQKATLNPTRTTLIPAVTHKQKKRDRMTNLLQENKEIESHRTNCTFGFLPTQRQTRKNQKSNFLPTLEKVTKE